MTAEPRLGCVTISHSVLGWCGNCPGRTVGGEVIAWRIQAAAMIEAGIPEVDLTPPPPPPQRVVCSVCSRPVPLLKSGKMRNHTLPNDNRTLCWGNYMKET